MQLSQFLKYIDNNIVNEQQDINIEDPVTLLFSPITSEFIYRPYSQSEAFNLPSWGGQNSYSQASSNIRMSSLASSQEKQQAILNAKTHIDTNIKRQLVNRNTLTQAGTTYPAFNKSEGVVYGDDFTAKNKTLMAVPELARVLHIHNLPLERDLAGYYQKIKQSNYLLDVYKSVNEDVEKYRYQNNYSMAQKALEEYFNLAFPTVRTGGVIYNGHTGYGREYSGEFEGKKIKIGSDSGDLLLDNNINNLITPSYNATERLPYGGITRMFDRKMAFRCLEEYGNHLQEFVTITGDEDVAYIDENGKEYSASSITYQLEVVYSDGVLKVESKYLNYILDSFSEVARVSEQNKKAYEKPKKSKKAAAM